MTVCFDIGRMRESLSRSLLYSLFLVRSVVKHIRYSQVTILVVEIVRKGRDGYRDYENAAKSRNYADESMDASFA